MDSPIQVLEKSIQQNQTQLNIMNTMMVTHLRAQIYREKVARGQVLDPDAFEFLHVMSNFGTQDKIDVLRGRICETNDQLFLQKRSNRIYFDAMHQAMHEVIGECMYEDDLCPGEIR